MANASLTLPLRGLSGPDAQATVDRALAGLAGVRTAHADVSTFRLHIEYDDLQVSRETIHAALAAAGIAHAANDSHSHADRVAASTPERSEGPTNARGA